MEAVSFQHGAHGGPCQGKPFGVGHRHLQVGLPVSLDAGLRVGSPGYGVLGLHDRSEIQLVLRGHGRAQIRLDLGNFRRRERSCWVEDVQSDGGNRGCAVLAPASVGKGEGSMKSRGRHELEGSVGHESQLADGRGGGQFGGEGIPIGIIIVRQNPRRRHLQGGVHEFCESVCHRHGGSGRHARQRLDFGGRQGAEIEADVVQATHKGVISVLDCAQRRVFRNTREGERGFRPAADQNPVNPKLGLAVLVLGHEMVPGTVIESLSPARGVSGAPAKGQQQLPVVHSHFIIPFKFKKKHPSGARGCAKPARHRKTSGRVGISHGVFGGGQGIVGSGESQGLSRFALRPSNGGSCNRHASGSDRVRDRSAGAFIHFPVVHQSGGERGREKYKNARQESDPQVKAVTHGLGDIAAARFGK